MLIPFPTWSKKSRQKCKYLKKLKECTKFRQQRVIVGLVGLVTSCHRVFVGISWVTNFFLWVFRGSQLFSRGYFVGSKFFLVGNFVVFSCWLHEKKWPEKVSWKYISNYVFYSIKSILTVVNSAYVRKVLHLLNYLCYYADLVCTTRTFS